MFLRSLKEYWFHVDLRTPIAVRRTGGGQDSQSGSLDDFCISGSLIPPFNYTGGVNGTEPAPWIEHFERVPHERASQENKSGPIKTHSAKQLNARDILGMALRRSPNPPPSP